MSIISVSITIGVIIATLCIIGNGACLILICKHRKLQNIDNLLIASLATADLLVGVISIPCFLITQVGLPHNLYGCIFMLSIMHVCTQVSVFSLLTFAIDKFVAIRYTFFYNTHVTPRIIFLANFVTWILGIGFGLLPMCGAKWDWNEGDICTPMIYDLKYIVYIRSLTSIPIPLLLMLFIYLYIFHIARKQLRQIASLEVLADGVNRDNQRLNQSKYIRKQLMAAQKFGVIIYYMLDTCPNNGYALIIWSQRRSSLLCLGYLASSSKFCHQPLPICIWQ